MHRNALWNIARAAALVGVPLILLYLSMSTVLYAQEESDERDTQESKIETQEDLPRYTVTPVVANEKAKPRDIIKKELIVSNNTQQRVDLYIAVHNIDPTTGDQIFEGPTESDLSTSLANWIEITRGVIELGPGESRKVPYLIHVNLTAKPGSYFARVSFHSGRNRAIAEANEMNTELILNLEIQDDAKERLQLGHFTAEDTLVLGKSVDFSYQLENIGNRLVEPRGSIRIFNRRGEEVGSVPLNADGEEINPENKRQLAAIWSSEGRFGKYKAFLDLEYGENQLASVQDTLYFWVFPWKEIAAALIGVLVLAIIGTYIVHMRAMARPAPARVYMPEPEASRPEVPVAPTPVRSAASPPPPTHPSGAAVTLSPRTPRTNPAPQRQAVAAPLPMRQGGTVTLSRSGGGSQRATTNGNTVQLASRR